MIVPPSFSVQSSIPFQGVHSKKMKKNSLQKSSRGTLIGHSHSDDRVKNALIDFLLAFDRDCKKSEE